MEKFKWKEADFRKASETIIDVRRSNPGWLYNSGVTTSEPFEVKQKKENDNEKVSSLFRPISIEFENGLVGFDVFSEIFLKKTNGNPKSYFDEVDIVNREKTQSYKQKSHKGLIKLSSISSEKKNSSRSWEEHEERAFFNYFSNCAGGLLKDSITVVDYEMPLYKKHPSPERLKSVDVIGLSSNKEIAYLLELKNIGSEESLVRSALEIYTYYSRLGLNRTDFRHVIIEQIKNDYGPVFNNVTDIRPGVLLINGSNQFKVYDEMKKGDVRYKNLARLMDGLELNVFVVNRYRGKEIVPFKDEQDVVEYKEVENDKSKVRPVVRLAKDEIIRIEKAI